MFSSAFTRSPAASSFVKGPGDFAASSIWLMMQAEQDRSGIMSITFALGQTLRLAWPSQTQHQAPRSSKSRDEGQEEFVAAALQDRCHSQPSGPIDEKAGALRKPGGGGAGLAAATVEGTSPDSRSFGTSTVAAASWT
ncbi:unnamed protein product, partial [Durusdinium trenchii]